MITLVDFREEVRPSKLTLELSNGETLVIKPKRNFNENTYQAWLHLTSEYGSDERATSIINNFLNK